MRTEYAMLKLEYSNNPEISLVAVPLFYHTTKKKLYGTTKGFKYEYYPSLWLKDKNGKHLYYIIGKSVFDRALMRKRYFVYTINTEEMMRGFYR